MALLQELVPLSTPRGKIHVGSRCCDTASCERAWKLNTRCSFSPTLWCLCVDSSSGRHVEQGLLPGQKMVAEKLWRELFSDPSQWWDNRSEKVNPRYPDFKHKKTQQSLWLDNSFTPSWVKAELAIMAPDTIQSDMFSWNVRLRRHVKTGDPAKTMEVFQQMQREGMNPDKFTFVPVLNACSALQSLQDGRRVHEQIRESGYEYDVYVANCLVDMYAKCGSIKDAWSVFNNMRERNVVSWSAMIVGCVKSAQGLKAMELFREMQQEGVEPNAVTFLGALNACASVAALEEGRLVHEQIIQRGFESDLFIANCLVDMYTKCGSIGDAWNVFNKMRDRTVVSWSAMIVGYVKSGQGLKAMELFRVMQHDGVEPNIVTFVGVLSACASVGALEEGRSIHEQIILRGYECDAYVANCLVDMYAKCGSIGDAWSMFNKIQKRNVVSWTAMIGLYVKSEQGLMALKLFREMQEEGVRPNQVTFVGVLNACANVGALEEGRHVHEHIIQRRFQSDVYVATCLVHMYAKCGSIGDAWDVFNRMRERNVVSWSAMILGYVKSEQGWKAIELFRQMQQEGVEPNTITFIGVLNACASVAALEEGRSVHVEIIKRGFELDIYVATCLIDMYAKCGSIEDAWSVFSKMRNCNVVSWSAMIGGLAMHGHSKKAIRLFKRMGQEGVEINEITLTCLLSACSHGGLVKEGLRYFNCMTLCYNVLPTMAHFACMVDLLGRAGQLEEAEKMTKRMPKEKSGLVWMCLLGACRMHGNIEMAERAAKKCWELDPKNASGHVLLSNIYAETLKSDRPDLDQDK